MVIKDVYLSSKKKVHFLIQIQDGFTWAEWHGEEVGLLPLTLLLGFLCWPICTPSYWAWPLKAACGSPCQHNGLRERSRLGLDAPDRNFLLDSLHFALQ